MTGGPIGPIQVIPPGLTGLLQLKQTGRLPDSLSDVVAGVIELRDWYLTARRVDASGLIPGSTPWQVAAASLVTGGAGFVTFKQTAVPGTPPVQVPANQIWYVEQATCNLFTAVAADFFSFGLAISNQQGTSILSVGPVQVDAGLGRNRELTTKADRGFWAFPGDQFGIWVQDVSSAAGVPCTLSIRATPCTPT